MLLSISSFSDDFRYLTFGPFVHVHFGKEKTCSYGIEASYWSYRGDYILPVGFDIGLEFEKSIFRFYSDFKALVAFLGLSAGPVFEFKKNLAPALGLQGSAWLGLPIPISLLTEPNLNLFILTGDVRFRKINNQNFTSLGGSFKAGVGETSSIFNP